MTRSANPFRYFDSSPEVIRLVVMMYVKYPLSLRNVEDLLFERGIDICHETVRLEVTFPDGYVEPDFTRLSWQACMNALEIYPGLRDVMRWAGWSVD